ncbi:Actin-interacting protein 1-like, partial [Homarus americanus]
ICVIRDDKKVGSFPISWDGLCVAALKDGGNEVAVGGGDNLIHVYTLSGNTLTEKTTLEHLGPVTDLSYSPDNGYLVACDANRKVLVYTLPSYEKFNKIELTIPQSQVTGLVWMDNEKLVSAGHDGLTNLWCNFGDVDPNMIHM